MYGERSRERSPKKGDPMKLVGRRDTVDPEMVPRADEAEEEGGFGRSLPVEG